MIYARIFIIVLAGLFGSGVGAQSVEIKGIQLSTTTKRDLLKKWPVRCEPVRDSIWEERCLLKKGAGMVYGDVPVRDALVLLHNGRANKIVLSFTYVARSRLLELLNAKFGDLGGVCDQMESSCTWLINEQEVRMFDKTREVWVSFDDHRPDAAMDAKRAKMEERKAAAEQKARGNM